MFLRYCFLQLAVIAFCVSTIPVSAKSLPHTFPRTANYFLNWDITQQDADRLAKWDVVILDMEIQQKRPELLTRIREMNPNIVLLVYLTPQEIIRGYSTTVSTMRRALGNSISDSWYLKNSQGKKLTWWPGTYLLNVTNSAPTVNGKRFNEHLVDFVVHTLLGSGYWDGVFYDNTWDGITYFAGNDIDLNGDGRIDTKLNEQWQEGMRFIYEQTRQKAPAGTIIIGNGTTKAYTDVLNGKLLENTTPEKWQEALDVYKHNDSAVMDPKINILNVNTGNTGNISYKDVRFGLTSSLLQDGYYSYDFGDKDHGQLWWYDEYDVDLGNPTGDAIKVSADTNIYSSSVSNNTSYEPDVWRRDFENGLALVNSTNEQQRIDLGGEYEKISGTQDTTVNDGSIVTETTVDGHDGVVLLKTFSTLHDVAFQNGAFARFFRPDGTRVRNGFFVFEESQKAGDTIVHIDVNGNGMRDLLVVSQNKITVWRDDGQVYMRLFPYTARYQGNLQIALGDITGDGEVEIIVAPTDGYPAPIKIYSRHGVKIRNEFYPFGPAYTGGYTLAVGDVLGMSPQEIIVGTGKGVQSTVSIFGDGFELKQEWHVYDAAFTGGISVAAGDVDGEGYDEIVVGAGKGKKPEIRVYDSVGKQLYDQFLAYTAVNEPGIGVQVVDVDFDGKEDIVGLSTGVGF